MGKLIGGFSFQEVPFHFSTERPTVKKKEVKEKRKHFLLGSESC